MENVKKKVRNGKSHKPIDNLYSVIYFGDSNVTVGKSFFIRCLADRPIEWHKDGEPIQKHFVRHSKDEFTYTVRDYPKSDDSGKVESTLSVNRAILKHEGRYQCNMNHENSHLLRVLRNDLMPTIDDNDSDEEQEMGTSEHFAALDDDDDHINDRLKFETPIGDDRIFTSTMMMMPSSDVTETSKAFEASYEMMQIDDDDDSNGKSSHERQIDDTIQSSDYYESLTSPITLLTTSSTSTATTTTITTTTVAEPIHTTNIPLTVHPTRIVTITQDTFVEGSQKGSQMI